MLELGWCLPLSQIETRRGFLCSLLTLDKSGPRGRRITMGEAASFGWRRFLEKGFSCKLSAVSSSLARQTSASDLTGGTTQLPLQGAHWKDKVREVSTYQIIQGLINHIYRFGHLKQNSHGELLKGFKPEVKSIRLCFCFRNITMAAV